MRSAGLADTPRLLAVLQRFENNILALGLDPREFKDRDGAGHSPSIAPASAR